MEISAVLVNTKLVHQIKEDVGNNGSVCEKFELTTGLLLAACNGKARWYE
jgi:hypothetical protein